MNSKKNSDLQLIGKIKDAHALRGELLMIVFSKEHEPWLNLKEIYLAKDEATEVSLLKIKSIRNAKLGLILNSQEIKDRTEAEKFKGLLVYVKSELFNSKAGERIFLKEILNFQVYDGESLLGPITGFSSNGPQDLLQVQIANSETRVEIPFVEAFIVKLDFQNRKLKMNLPEGLVEVNSSKEDN